MMKEWKRVTKQELIEFVESYPFPLEYDFFMDWYSWNDFRDGRKWPESVVAMASGYDDEFKIYDGYIQDAQGASRGGKLMDELVNRLRLAQAVLSRNKDLIAFLSDAADAIESMMEMVAEAYGENANLIQTIEESRREWVKFKKRPLTEEEQEEHPEWIYIMDCETPDDGQDIMVSNGKLVWEDTYYDDGDKCFLNSDMDLEECWWQKMPDPPKEES